jgi:hypothetical protein
MGRPAPDQIFVRDGNIRSSTGIAAGVDLALAMVAEGSETVVRPTFSYARSEVKFGSDVSKYGLPVWSPVERHLAAHATPPIATMLMASAALLLLTYQRVRSPRAQVTK